MYTVIARTVLSSCKFNVSREFSSEIIRLNHELDGDRSYSEEKSRVRIFISLQRGLLHEYKLEYTEAKQCYQNAVSINPSHIKSLQHLVTTLTSNRPTSKNTCGENFIVKIIVKVFNREKHISTFRLSLNLLSFHFI